MVRSRQYCAKLVAVFFSIALTSSAQAATRTWDGGTGVGDGSNWSTPANWDDVAPVSGADSLVFAGTNDLATSNDILGNPTFNGITFNAGSGAFTLAGSPITLGGATVGTLTSAATFTGLSLNAITNSSTNLQTVSLGLTLAPGNHTFGGGTNGLALNPAGGLAHNVGAIAILTPGTGGITTTTITNTNGIVGGWATVGTDWATVNGTNNIVALPAAGYTDVTAGGTITSAGTTNVRVTTQGANVTMATGGITDINSLLYSANNALNQTVEIGASSTLRLGAQGGIFRTGTTNPTSGQSLVIGSAANVGTLTAGGAVDTPGEIVLNTGGGGNSNTAMQINSTITNNGAGAVTLVKTGQSAAVLAGTNTYSGGTIIAEGRLNGAAANFGSGSITIVGGGQLFTSSTFANTVPFFIAGTGTGENNGNGALRIDGNGTINGTVTLIGNARIVHRASSGVSNLNGQITGNYSIEFGGNNNANTTPVIRIASTLNNWTGDTRISESNTLRLGASEVIPNGAGFGNVVMNSNNGAASTFSTVLDLNGFNETINGLSRAGNATTLTNCTIENDVILSTATLTLGDNNQTSTFDGRIRDNLGTGGIVAIRKIGTGTQTFSGTLTYTGATTVDGGRLNINSTLASSAVTVNNGGILGGSGNISQAVTVNSGGAVAGGSTLTLAGTVNLNAGSAVNATPNAVPNNATPSVNVAGAGSLFVNGAVTVNVSGTVEAGNTYRLLSHNGYGAGGFGNFSLGNLPNRTTANLVDGGTGIDLNVTLVDRPRWSGALGGGVWSTATQAAPKNWVLNSDGTTPTDYLEGDNVLFDDTATGTTTVNVSGGDVAPIAVEFSNPTKTYTIKGPNNIISGGTLKKSLGGSVILETSATFAGATTISAGTLQIGNGSTTGSLSTSSVANSGTLAFNRSDNITFGTAISGAAGAVQQNGAGTTTLSVASSFGGGLTINNGGVRLTNATAGGTGAITVNSGGTLVYGAVVNNAVTLAGGTLGTTATLNPTTTAITAAAATSSTIRMADALSLPGAPVDAIEMNFTGDLNGSGDITVLSNGQDILPDGGSGFRLRGTGASTYSGTITFANNVKGEIQSSTVGAFSPAGTGKFKVTAGDMQLGTSLNAGTTTGGYAEFNIRNNSTGNIVFGNDLEVVGTGTALMDPIGSAPAGSTITMGKLKIKGGQELGVYLGAEPNHPVIFTSVTLGGGDAKLSPKIAGFGADTTPSSDLVLGDIDETSPSSITMNGARTLYLAGAGGYSGTTTINSVSVSPFSSTLQVGGIGGTGTGALGGGNVINNGSLVFFRTNAYTASNDISGSGSVDKRGNDVLTLTGNNSYAGKTAVLAGTLLVNGTHNGGNNYNVSSGATLGGTGTITPASGASINTDTGGIIAPGASIGTLTVDGGTAAGAVLSLASGSLFSYELGAGHTSDKLTITNAAANDVSFNNATINFTDLTSGSLASGDYTLFSADVAGAYAGLTVNGSNEITAGLSIGSGLGSYANKVLKLSGNDIILNIAAPLLVGDYNDDKEVNAADYVIWKKNVGSTNVLPNDPIGGTIGDSQYNQWKANFGNVASGSGSGGGAGLSGAVPEPTSAMLCVLAAAGVVLASRRRTPSQT